MSTSNKSSLSEKVVNKRSADSFDRLIFEKGLRIKQVIVDQPLDAMILLLSSGHVLKLPINHFSRLNNATQNDLNKWSLIDGGVGIHWESLDEDLSLKGLIKESALISVLHRLEEKNDVEGLLVL